MANDYLRRNQMLDAICSGKLIQNPISRIGASGKPFTNFLLSVGIGEDQPIVVSGIAFGDASERISRLTKGDPVSVIGSLKPSSWSDKVTGENKHGFNITVNNSLSPYDIQKRRKPKPDVSGHTVNDDSSHPFNDDLSF
jgi:single-strand DNA-binding protein